MNSSELLKLNQSNQIKYVRYNPTTDSSTHIWKQQLQAAGNSKQNIRNSAPNPNYITVCDNDKKDPISNHFTATTVGANSDYQQTLLYKAGKETCGCSSDKPPLFQILPSENISTPKNPVLGVPTNYCQVTSLETKFKTSCYTTTSPQGSSKLVSGKGKGMIYPS